MTHAELVDIGRRWLLRSPRMENNAVAADRRGACPVVLTEIVTGYRETPDALGWCDRGSFLIECKISRADFRADAKKTFRLVPDRGVGDYRYYLVPTGLISADEVPASWGLLYVTRRGGVRIERHAERQDANKDVEVGLLISTLRRLRIEPDECVSLRTYTYETKNTASLSVAVAGAMS